MPGVVSAHAVGGCAYIGGMGLTRVTGPPNSGRAGEVLGAYRARLEEEPILVVPAFRDVEHTLRELAADGAVFGAGVGGGGGVWGREWGAFGGSLEDDPRARRPPRREARLRRPARAAHRGGCA